MQGRVLLLSALLTHAVTALPTHPWRGVARTQLTGDVDDGSQTFEQQVDHFAPDGSRVSWQQRWFVNDTAWLASNRVGPVFLCVGGEGPALQANVVSLSGAHCADAVSLAQSTGALMLALEHRFYGESIPTPDFSTASLRLLSAHQALADIARFHSYISSRYQLDAQRNPWIAWGGSYPGMLASWCRLKLPHLFHGAVGSSAPVGAVGDYTGYNDVVGYALELRSVGGSSGCVSAVRSAFAEIGRRLQTVEGRRSLEWTFPVCGARCDELPGGPLDEPYAQRTFAEELTYLFPAQSNDPACDLPACNLERCCDTMRDETLGTPLQRLAAIAAAVTPTGGCVGGSYASAVAELTDVSLEGGTARVWFWQTCTAFGFYQTCDSDSACPFMRTPWLSNLSASLEDCRIAFGDDARDGVMRAIEATNEAFGGVTPAATRLLFVNGEIDPWRAASVTNSPSSGIEVLFVPGASHHAWTHPERANDSHALIAARQSIHATVTRWLAEPSAVAEPPPACVWSAGSVLNVVLAVVTALIAGAMSTLAFQTLQKRGAEVPASPPVDPAASEGAYVALPGGETAP